MKPGAFTARGPRAARRHDGMSHPQRRSHRSSRRAANAVAQAAQGWKRSDQAVGKLTLDFVDEVLVGQLRTDTDPDVRASLAEAIGRLPYIRPEQARRADAVTEETC